MIADVGYRMAPVRRPTLRYVRRSLSVYSYVYRRTDPPAPRRRSMTSYPPTPAEPRREELRSYVEIEEAIVPRCFAWSAAADRR